MNKYMSSQISFVQRFILVLFVFFANVSIAQDEFQLEEAFRLSSEDNSRIEDLTVFDFGDDGIFEIICEIAGSVRGEPVWKMGISHSENWIFVSENMEYAIENIIIGDFNQDLDPDIFFAFNTGEEGDREQGIYVFFGPDFSEMMSHLAYYFDRFLMCGGDRILEDGSTKPLVFIEDSTYFLHPAVEGREYHEHFDMATYWEGTWETNEIPRPIGATPMPISYNMVRTENGTRNDFFIAGWNRYLLNVRNGDAEWNTKEYYFQLCTSHLRRYDLPDSLTLRIFDDLPEETEVLQIFNFCENSCVLDLDRDERLEWVQPYWERNLETGIFSINLTIFYPDSLHLDREYTEELEDIFYDEEILPNPILGVIPIDIDIDGTYELLFAVQSQPLKVVDYRTMEVIAVSDNVIPDQIDSLFEIGHFNDPELLQILYRVEDEVIIFNLPEDWRAPYLDINSIVSQIPLTFALLQPYPNPFNASTKISYTLPKSGQVRLSVHDVQGREIEVLHDGLQTAGFKTVTWDAINQSSSLYFCRLESGGKTAMVKLMLVK